MKNNRSSKNLVAVISLLAGILISTNLFSQQADFLSKVRDNDIDAVKTLIAAGADVNQEDDMMALNGRNTEVAKLLIEKGADIRLKGSDGATALILACGCSEEIASYLLKKGADIHALTDRGMGVFTQCTSVGLMRETVSYDFAGFLLSEGADIDEANTTEYYGGYTPLFWAAMSNEEKLVSFLVKHGANVNAKSSKGKTPLSIATEAGYSSIVALLKAAGAK